ncbi:nucleotide exchange factor GrpE [Microvirga sp. STR05]|uniref:Protein GrpE n=1 Tax=Hymenobacter duratus TaxID=2771356 RepID=A0ABR8JFQ3_9BACT|nr:nucleotide exchange factor GrpE [Hymenobacter duratus]MBD2715702.1 nucleotide exchange factor GrpE [Hymenobacter duratus]MBR7950612.1 nucleotide exchange factor GrpE [Microvirga sp. STR05]
MADDKNTQPTDDTQLDQNGTPADHVAGELTEEPNAPEIGEVEGSEGAPKAAGSKTDAELADLKDKYLRLAAEFENYKRRTTKERADLFKSANQELMVALLPVLDDFDRARHHTRDTDDANAVRESIDIIQNKLQKTLNQKGLAPMEAKGGAFDPDLHEAITQIPAPSEELKGKIVDEVEKGYYLGDKVIRHAKVVLGQ